MRDLSIALLMLLATTTSALAQSGTLVVVGGGNTGPDIVTKTLQLAGGTQAIVAVLPQSSAEPDAGDASVKMWRDAGAREAHKVSFGDRRAAAAVLERATLIWMPGGDQNRFMKAIDGTGLAEVIRARYQAGAVIGGTSAGAAVISEAMITGEADLQSLTAGKTEIAKGLALWPEVIVDQHFLKRQRANRLLSAVIDHPSLVGRRHRRIDRRRGARGIVRRHRQELRGRHRRAPGDGGRRPGRRAGNRAESHRQRAPYRNVLFAEVGSDRIETDFTVSQFCRQSAPDTHSCVFCTRRQPSRL